MSALSDELSNDDVSRVRRRRWRRRRRRWRRRCTALSMRHGVLTYDNLSEKGRIDSVYLPPFLFLSLSLSLSLPFTLYLHVTAAEFPHVTMEVETSEERLTNRNDNCEDVFIETVVWCVRGPGDALKSHHVINEHGDEGDIFPSLMKYHVMLRWQQRCAHRTYQVHG